MTSALGQAVKVLIVAPADDAHAAAVSQKLEEQHGVDARVWDIANLPRDSTLSLQLSNAETPKFRLQTETDEGTDFAAVWWRRAHPPLIDSSITHPALIDFCGTETVHFSRGALSCPVSTVVNDPFAEARANKKPIQLAVALSLGIRIPETMMSNDPEQVRRFIEEHPSGCVHKAFGPASWQMLETRTFTRDYLESLDSVSYSPVIVQEHIERGVDVRVNIFGARVHAAEVRTLAPEAHVDWRVDLEAKWTPHELPERVTDKLLELLSRLGLDYGCIDLRRTPNGEYVFFEVNPSGQFLFIEMDTGQPLSASMAHLLVERGKRTAGLAEHGPTSPPHRQTHPDVDAEESLNNAAPD